MNFFYSNYPSLLANGNCSSLLNAELDDEQTSSNEALNNRRRNLSLLTDQVEFNTFSNKRDELKLSGNVNCAGSSNNNNNYYSSFNRFLVSSPLISNASSPKESSGDEALPEQKTHELLNTVGTAAITKTLHMPPMMTIRSQNIPHGNFNAKITTGFTSSIAAPDNNRPQFNTFTMSRNVNEPTKFESPLYDNPKGSASDLSKLLNDNNFRFADLFNELSPNLVPNNNPQGTLPKNKPLYSNRAFQSTLPKNQNNMSLFQHFPSMASPKHNSVQQQSLQQSNTHLQNSRQNLLQPTISAATQLQMNSSFNKFPNAFIGTDTTTEAKSSSTSKFYNNFYRNPSLRTDSDNCKL